MRADAGTPIVYAQVAYAEGAYALAERIDGVAHIVGNEVVCDTDGGQLVLHLDGQGLALKRQGMELRGDFSRMMPRVRQGALQRELLVRAARIKGVERPVAVDATAGLGEDAFLLAAAGFEVTLCESNPIIAALLEDALSRARKDPALESIAARMHAIQCDSGEFLKDLPESPDIVYLDPMFPSRTKSAAVKKKFQLIHDLERPCDVGEEERLLKAALAARPRRVVIKRPAKAPSLAGCKPSYCISGKAVRYDCLACAV